MQVKERYRALELLLSFCLASAVFLMLPEGLARFSLYLIGGLAAGFSASWFNRKGAPIVPGLIITAASSIVFVWTVYSVVNSSFYYRDVILIGLRSVVILEAILSLGACLPRFIFYIQCLTIPIFMSNPLFIAHNTAGFIILSAAYIILWLAILRLKAYAAADRVKDSRSGRYYSIFSATAVILISVSCSSFLAWHIDLRQIKIAGLLPDKNFLAQPDIDNLEKEFYALQNKISDKVNDFIPKLGSTRQMQQMLLLFSHFINQTKDAYETEKAEAGLVSFLNTAGPGIEKREADEIITLLKKHTDKKPWIKLRETKEDIREELLKGQFRLNERMSLLNRLNRMQYSQSLEDALTQETRVLEAINNSSAAKSAKRQVKGLLWQFRQWKIFELYRKEQRRLEDSAGPIEEEAGLRDLKLELSLGSKTNNALSGLAGLNLDAYRLGDFQEAIQQAVSGQAAQAFLTQAYSLREEFKKEGMALEGNLKEALEIKTALLLRNKFRKMLKILKASVLPDSGRSFVQEAQNLETQASSRLLSDGLTQLRQKVEQLERAGFISGKDSRDLKNEIDALGDLLTFRLDNLAKEEKQLPEALPPPAMREQLSAPAIESGPLGQISQPARLISIILSPTALRLSLNSGSALKAEGYFSDDARKDITDIVEWQVSDGGSIRINRGEVRPLWFGRAKVHAEYEGLKSLPADIEIILTFSWLKGLFLSAIFFLSSLLAAGFILLYFFRESRKNELKTAYTLEPKVFIIKLYANLLEVLVIFALGNKDNLPPISYAKFVEGIYPIPGNPFLKLAAKAGEAKYSSHTLEKQDAAIALNDYNTLVKFILSRSKGFLRIFRVALSFLRRKPLLIKEG